MLAGVIKNRKTYNEIQKKYVEKVSRSQSTQKVQKSTRGRRPQPPFCRAASGPPSSRIVYFQYLICTSDILLCFRLHFVCTSKSAHFLSVHFLYFFVLFGKAGNVFFHIVFVLFVFVGSRKRTSFIFFVFAWKRRKLSFSYLFSICLYVLEKSERFSFICFRILLYVL